MSEKRSRRPRRRFKKRWVVAALFVAFLFAAAWALESALASSLRQNLETRLASGLGAEVEVGAVEIDWLPPTARVRDVVVTTSGESPLLEIESAEAEARWSEILSAPRRLRALRVTRPRLVVRVDEEGRHNLPTPEPRESSGEGITIGSVEVRGGEVVFGERRVPLDLDVRQLMARAAGAPGNVFAGALDASDVTVGLPNGATYAGAVSARASWSDGGLLLLGGRVSGPELALVLREGALDPGSGEWRLGFDASGTTRVLDHLGVDASSLDGDWGFTGTLEGGEGWALTGDLTSRRLGWDGLAIDRVASRLRVDSDRFVLEELSCAFGGAELAGRIEGGMGDAASITVDLAATGGRLGKLMETLRVDLPGLLGDWGGSFVYSFATDEPLAGRGTGNFRVALKNPTGGALLRRNLSLAIDRGELRFSTIGKLGEGELLSASGRFGLLDQRGEVDYRFSTDRLESWAAVLAGPEAAEGGWPLRSGAGAATGRAIIVDGSWSTRLELDLQDVRAGELSTESVRGALTLSPEGARDLRLDLARPGAAMGVAGSIGVVGEGAPPSFDLDIEIGRWPASEIGRQIALPFPLEGPLSASVTLGGDGSALRGRFDGSIDSGSAAGFPFERLDAAILLEPERLGLERLTATLAGGSISASGPLALSGDGTALDLRAVTLDLAREPLSGVLPPGVQGVLDGAGSLTGSLERPVMRLELATSGLKFAGQEPEALSRGRLVANWADGRVDVEGSFGEALSLSGGGRLDSTTVDLEIGVASTQLGFLTAGFLPAQLADLDGSFLGTVRLGGGEAPVPELELEELELRQGDRILEALEPVVVRLRDGALEIDSFFLGDDATGSEIFVFGRAPLSGEEVLDLNAQVSIDTRWLGLALPEWSFENGRFEGLATVGGTVAEPLINGQGEVRQEALRLPGVQPRATNLRMVLLFYPGRIVLDSGEALFAGGNLRTAGSIDLYAESVPGYRFQVAARRLELSYPEGWQMRAGADLTVASVPDGRQVRGQVDVARALYTDDVPIGVTQLLQGVFARSPEIVEETDELLASTQVNVAVRGDGAMRIRNNVADLRGDIDLVVRGNLARPVIFGDVRMEPGGTLLYSGNEYRVARAELSFVNPYRIEPVVDLEATTRLREYDVTLNLAGTLERLDVDFASNPPLADLDVLALLAGGEERVAGSSSGRPGVTAESFLYGQAASVVAERVNRLFGLDKFRIDPLTGDSGDLSSARVTVGKRLSRDLFATYSYDPSTSKQQILQLEWQISRQLTLVATQNGDGSYAVDARWRKSF